MEIHRGGMSTPQHRLDAATDSHAQRIEVVRVELLASERGELGLQHPGQRVNA